MDVKHTHRRAETAEKSRDANLKEYNDEYESSIRHIKMIVPLVDSLLHSGLFSNPTCVSDEILLKK